MNKSTSRILVFIQFGCIFFLAGSGRVIAWNKPVLLTLFLFACFYGTAALLAMKWSQFSIFPEPKGNGELITRWPYKYVRHPMYTAILLATAVWVTDDFTWWRASVYLLLFINQIIKLRYEEGLLISTFPAYKNYMSGTWRLLPYLY